MSSEYFGFIYAGSQKGNYFTKMGHLEDREGNATHPVVWIVTIGPLSVPLPCSWSCLTSHSPNWQHTSREMLPGPKLDLLLGREVSYLLYCFLPISSEDRSEWCYKLEIQGPEINVQVRDIISKSSEAIFYSRYSLLCWLITFSRAIGPN